MADSTLYEAILARRSVRRYEAPPLDPATLDAVRGIVDGARELSAGVTVAWQLRDCTPTQNLPGMLGGYGRLISPPHVLVPAATDFGDERAALVELGYQAEQVAVRLAALGLGSCFVGALPRGDATRAGFGLPARSLVAAVLAFGRPSTGLGGRAINQLMRTVTGATSKRPASKIYFEGDFATPGAPLAAIAPLVEAARNAPSAVDAQPWRISSRGDDLFVYVERQSPRYGAGRRLLYRYHDGGACLANVALAADALGLGGVPRLLDSLDSGLPPCPPDLEPLAAFGPLAS